LRGRRRQPEALLSLLNEVGPGLRGAINANGASDQEDQGYDKGDVSFHICFC
jgi:hypothetical protein